VAELLVARGYRLEAARYYQLTRPVPQLMALSERSAGGLGCGALLLLNRAARRSTRRWAATRPAASTAGSCERASSRGPAPQ
jgi:hypothetical protein